MSILAPFMRRIWGFFQLNIPGTNLEFKDLYIGIIVASLSLVILRQILGLEIGGFRTIVKSVSHKNISRYKNSKNRKDDEN